jgi:hypothetical protein
MFLESVLTPWQKRGEVLISRSFAKLSSRQNNLAISFESGCVLVEGMLSSADFSMIFHLSNCCDSQKRGYGFSSIPPSSEAELNLVVMSIWAGEKLN